MPLAWLLLLSDPRIADVPVRECGEPLVDLHVTPGLLLDTRKDDATGAWARLRSGVVDRLLDAQQRLPDGVSLLVVEGLVADGDELDLGTAVGFVNYLPEWWHWSYGDRYWAATTDADSAVYGPL